MSLYLSDEVIRLSFERLAPISSGGKSPLERTSALMYFLAFDSVVKARKRCPVDLNPKTSTGQNNRQAMTLEYVKLVKLKSSDDKIRQVSTLGRISKGDVDPEKRISSNFFTVPVKKASKSSSVYSYPNRPAPVLKMGLSATRIEWGVDYHDEWKASLPILLQGLKGSTPFIDLAVFVTRNDRYKEGPVNLVDALSVAIHCRFSDELATYWSKRMVAEKVFCRYAQEAFSTSYGNPLSEDHIEDGRKGCDRDVLEVADKDVLVDRILYLEGVLDVHGIAYRSIGQ